MMNTFDESTILYLLLISNALLVAASGIAISRFQKLIRDSRQFWTSPTGTAVRTEQRPEPQDSQDTRADKELEKRLTVLQNVVARIASSAPTTNEGLRTVPVDNAVRMAKQGASVDELTQNCGLSIGEARLVHKIHGEQHRVAAR